MPINMTMEKPHPGLSALNRRTINPLGPTSTVSLTIGNSG